MCNVCPLLLPENPTNVIDQYIKRREEPTSIEHLVLLPMEFVRGLGLDNDVPSRMQIVEAVYIFRFLGNDGLYWYQFNGVRIR